MKVLAVTDQPIDPPRSGGAERVRFLLERLSRAHDVEILNLVGFREAKGLRRLGPRLAIRKVPAWQRSLAHHLEIRRIAPSFVAHYLHALLAPLYGGAIRSARPDVVQVDGIALGPLLSVVPRGTPRVYSSHNVESEYYVSTFASFPLRGPLAAALERIERAMLRRADLVVSVSERDRDLLASRFGAARERIVVVPNGYDEERFRPLRGPERLALRARMGIRPDEGIILFCGSAVPHNTAAARFLVTGVGPRLAAGRRILIVGSAGVPLAFAAGPRVTVTGPVPDVLPYFQAADVAVNPVETGGGTNVKILQYLAAGLPVLSTAFGMRGLPDLAPDVRLVENDRLAESLAAPLPPLPAARPAALDGTSWGACADRLAAAYEALLARSGRAPEGAAA